MCNLVNVYNYLKDELEFATKRRIIRFEHHPTNITNVKLTYQAL